MTMQLSTACAGHVPTESSIDSASPRCKRTGSRAAANAAMNRYATGDDDAFAALYPVLAPELRRYLLRQTRNASRAEDLLQQTLLQIHCARNRFAVGADVFPWAFSIARRFLIDSIRWERREAARTRAVATTVASTGTLSDDIVHSRRAVRALVRELGRLPDAQRIAFELVKTDGLSLREAAEALGTTVVAVKLRTHRAYVALRDAIGDDRGTAGDRASGRPFKRSPSPLDRTTH